MAVKKKPGCYCNSCEREVAGEKQTSRARNLGGAFFAPMTGGLSLAAMKQNEWFCPVCGNGVVTPLFRHTEEQLDLEKKHRREKD